jgi:3-hydroxymyristoyl/3-hydroxydecanoyl-(acyl carrier protein) dehydratase
MAERFSAFSFVDRIIRLDTGTRVTGRYTIPLAATRFPASLIAEAVGQLAAWAAMSRLAFTRRPVAGLAHETLYLGTAAPGDTLDLAVAIESCDETAIAYGGTACVAGTPVLVLRDYLGPMLPMEDFDAPEALRADFETLCGAGARAERVRGVPAPHFSVKRGAAGEHLLADLHVPAAAPFFADHFRAAPCTPGPCSWMHRWPSHSSSRARLRRCAAARNWRCRA